jgi:CelD/BcsL family acetyltransferase involved in cellulose biosynthesis
MTNGSTSAGVLPADFGGLFDLWSKHRPAWRWTCPFTTPPWLVSWWRCFGATAEPMLLTMVHGGRPVGMAPLMRRGRSARFMGSGDLCDHGDMPVEPDRAEKGYGALLRHLASAGIRRLELGPVLPEASVMTDLLPAARAAGCRVTVRRQGVGVRMSLPDSWQDYLSSLDGKQRHEVRRKLRKASAAGRMSWRIARSVDETAGAMETFLHLFRLSRPDKDGFMTARREVFFRKLAEALARQDMLRLWIVAIDGRPAAAVFCCELGRTSYLYNSGFDPRFRGVSIGIVSKLLTIRASIESGMKVYDFLNGNEAYKARLGGGEVVLSTCVVDL